MLTYLNENLPKLCLRPPRCLFSRQGDALCSERASAGRVSPGGKTLFLRHLPPSLAPSHAHLPPSSSSPHCVKDTRGIRFPADAACASNHICHRTQITPRPRSAENRSEAIKSLGYLRTPNPCVKPWDQKYSILSV